MVHFFFLVYCFLNNVYCENLKSKFNHFQDYLDSRPDYLSNACTSITLSKILPQYKNQIFSLFHSKPWKEFPSHFKVRKDGLHTLLQFFSNWIYIKITWTALITYLCPIAIQDHIYQILLGKGQGNHFFFYIIALITLT